MGLFKNVGVGSTVLIKEWLENELGVGPNHYEIHSDNTISIWDHNGIYILKGMDLKYQINTTNVDLYFHEGAVLNNYKKMPYNAKRIVFYHTGRIPDIDQSKNFVGYAQEINFVECQLDNFKTQYEINNLLITDSQIGSIVSTKAINSLRLEHCDVKNIQLNQNVMDNLIITNCNIDNLDFFKDIKINNKLRFFNNSINLTIDDLRARNIIYNPRNVKLKPQ